MHPIVRLKNWKHERDRRKLYSMIRLQVVEVRNERERLQSHLDNCPNGDLLCKYRESMQHARTVLNTIEETLLKRLKSVS